VRKRAWLGLAVAAAALACAGGGSARPAAPASIPARLVLAAADVPGLRLVDRSADGARAALAGVLPPAAVPPGLPAQAAHFKRGTVELRSIAYVLPGPAAARGLLTKVVSRGHRVRVPVGDAGWLLPSPRADRPFVVAWRSGPGLGVVLLWVAHGGGSLAVSYARAADAHLARALAETAWERTLDGVRPDGTVPRAVALDLFALAYGGLPGIEQPAGAMPPSDYGTLAAVQLLRLWPTLTADQRRAAAAKLGVAGVARRPASRLGAVAYGDPSFTPSTAITNLAKALAASEGAKLGRTLRLQIVAGPSSASGSDDLYADTLPVSADGTATAGGPFCRIRVLAAGQDVQRSDASYFRKLMAHEVFHCFEFDIMGVAGVDRARPWLFEGAADWAGFSEVPQPYDKYGPDRLPRYLATCNSTPLFSRSYDAEGFFGHVQEVYGNLWSRLPAVLTAGDNEAVYRTAGGGEQRFLDNWASGVLVIPQYGLNWMVRSPVEAPEGSGCPPAPLPLPPGGTPVRAGPYLLSLYEVDPAGADPDTPLLHLRVPKSARFSDRSFDTTSLQDAWFCLVGDCMCPEGEEGSPPPAVKIARDAFLGISGGPDGVDGTASVVSLRDYCKKKEKPPTPPPGGPPVGGGGGGNGGGGGSGCGGGCGSTNGDPHLHTFDNRFYDFQAAGEFTLVRSNVDNLEIQSRQQPYPGSRTLAVDTAIAMRVGSDRVGVYGNDLAVRVDGNGFVPTARPQNLPGGGAVRLVQGQVEVRWPDGSIVRVWSVGGWGLALLLKPADARRGTLTGLLGNFDGDDENDLATRSGRRVDFAAATGSGAAAYRLLYRVLGDSWRVAQRQSLFDYAPGQSTATFTIRGFPARVELGSTLTPAQRRRAELVCRRLGVREPNTLEACILDVGATGDASFATAASELERTAGTFGKAGGTTEAVEGTWTPIGSAGRSGITVPSFALDGGQVVAAYLTAEGTAESATFAAAAKTGVGGLVHTTIVSRWSQLQDPILLPRPGGGLQALVAGFHSTTTGDPLNGVSLAPRNPDGTFGPPVPATEAGAVGGPGVLAPDGQPIWPGRGLELWRGSTAATSVDLHDALAPQTDVYIPSIARDAAGRYWLAWYGSSATRASGIFMAQIDPTTLQPVGPPTVAPGSNDLDNNTYRLALVCARLCRVVYVSPPTAGSGTTLVSWAPGEAAPTVVASISDEDLGAVVAAAYTAGGRLWTVWWGRRSNAIFAILGNAAGAGGRVHQLGHPLANRGSGALAAVADGDDLVAVISWRAGSYTRFAKVVGP